MKAKKLINWSELSRMFGLDRGAIRANNYPKKYKESIKELEKLVENWLNKVK